MTRRHVLVSPESAFKMPKNDICMGICDTEFEVDQAFREL